MAPPPPPWPNTIPASTASLIRLVALTASNLIRRQPTTASSPGMGAMGLVAKGRDCDVCRASMAEDSTWEVWRFSSQCVASDWTMGADVVVVVAVVLVVLRRAGLGMGGAGAGRTDICCNVVAAGTLPWFSNDEGTDGDGACAGADDDDTRMLSTPASSWAASCA